MTDSIMETTPENKGLETVENAHELEFSRENIEKLSKLIKLVDSDTETGLDLFCYTNCSEKDADIIKQSRGVGFKGSDLVIKGFSYTYEHNQDYLDQLFENISFNDCHFYDSHEGAVIRLFHFSGKWYISTHRKLDAFRSKWASKKSFGDFFKDALQQQVTVNETLRERIGLSEGDDVLEKFKTNVLDTDKQYMFLLLNDTENRLVSTRDGASGGIYHVGTFINGQLSMDEDVCIPYPEKHDFKTIDDIYTYVNNVDHKFKQGVIVFAPNNVQYKIYNNYYQKLLSVRGNEPSIKFRYLQVRMDSENNKTLRELYPEKCDAFDEYENRIYQIAKEIYKAYVDRFIKKLYVITPAEEFNIIKELHSWHLENRVENRISLDRVIQVLNTQTPTNINKMIRRVIQEENTKDSSENTLEVIKREPVEGTRGRGGGRGGRGRGRGRGGGGTNVMIPLLKKTQ